MNTRAISQVRVSSISILLLVACAPASGAASTETLPLLATTQVPTLALTETSPPSVNLFQSPFLLPVGEHPQDIVAVDLNGDGLPDLVSTNEGSSDVSVLLQNADGSFETEVRYPVGRGNVYIEAADLNADGNADVVTTNGGHATGLGEIEPGDDTISVLIGTGNGGFLPRMDFPAGPVPVGLAISDLNGDSILDVSVANRRGGTVTIFLGNTGWQNPTVVTTQIFPSGFTLTRWVALADLSRDGLIDIVVPEEQGRKVWVTLGRGDGTFWESVGYPTAGSQAVAVTPIDLNGDGYLDLAVANGYPASDVSVLLNQADATFSAAVLYPVGTYPHSVFGGDLDGDGFIDLVSGNDFDASISVLHGIGDGTFRDAITISSGSAGELGMILLADLNGDGCLDVVIANWDPNELSVLQGLCSAQ